MENRAYYDEFATRYEHQRGRGYHALLDDLEVDLVHRYARGAKVLEAGCGTGLILSRLKPPAAEVTGIDLSAGMLRHAAKRGLQVVQSSITALPFADESFDLVCSFKVLAHIEAIREAIAELSRVTRPGGHLILEFYNPWSLRYLVKKLKPATAISATTTDEAVYTRYDTLSTVERMLPPGHSVIDLRGIRILTPFAQAWKLPAAARLLRALEWHASDAPLLRRLGGFLVAVVEKKR